MYFIKFILMAVILLAVLALGLEFSTLHSDPVTVNYVLGTTTQPLSLVVICAFALGALLAILIANFIVWPLRWRLARLLRTLTEKEQEIQLLAKRLERSAAPVDTTSGTRP